MGDENIEGFKKTKLDDIIEDENENLQEGEIKKVLDENITQDLPKKVTDENTLTPISKESEVEGNHRSKSLDQEKNSTQVTNEPETNHTDEELTETEDESGTNADTTNTEYSTSEGENLTETDEGNELSEIAEGDEREYADEEIIGWDENDRDGRKLSATSTEKKSSVELAKYNTTLVNEIIDDVIENIHTSAENKDLVNEIIYDVLDNIHKEEIPEKIEKPKKRGPVKIIEDIKVNIDDLRKRYSEHGTEYANIISHLWKKGKARDTLIDSIKRKESRKVKGEDITSTSPFVSTQQSFFTYFFVFFYIFQ